MVWVEVVGFKQVSQGRLGEGVAFCGMGYGGSGCRPAGGHIPWFDRFSKCVCLIRGSLSASIEASEGLETLRTADLEIGATNLRIGAKEAAEKVGF